MARVSVVITSYNYGRFIADAIRSVLDQAYRDLEVVVCDNGSTDDTAAVVASFATDARLRFERNATNLGIVGNHNRGIALTSGEYILFLSADDFILPGHLAESVAFYDAHPEVALLSTSYLNADEGGRVGRAFVHPGHVAGAYEGGRNDFADLLSYDNYYDLASTLVRRGLFERYGKFDAKLNVGFDYEFFVRLSAADETIAFCPQPRVVKRVHGPQASGASYGASGAQFREHLHILEKHIGPRTAPAMRGNEGAIVALLQAKANNWPGMASLPPKELQRLRERANAVASRISFLTAAVTETTSWPTWSVVVTLDASDSVAVSATLQSLADQTRTDWEAIVVATGTIDLRAFIASLPGAERFRVLSMPGAVSLAAIRNAALKLARGRRIGYLDHGARFAPTYLAEMSAALDRGAQVARGTASVGGCGPIFATEQSRPLVADDVPLSALAHLRALPAVQRGFDERFTAIDAWEFRLRLESTTTSSTYVPAASVEVSPARRTRAWSFGEELEAVYAAFPDPALDDARQTYRSTAVPLASTALGDRGHELRVLRARAGNPERHHTPGALRMLMIDDCVPHLSGGRGYPRANAIITGLIERGIDLTLYPLVNAQSDPQSDYRDLPSQLTIWGDRGEPHLASTLADRAQDFDVLWVSRPTNMRVVKAALEAIPGALDTCRLVYDAEAVFSERRVLSARAEGVEIDPAARREMLAAELALTSPANLVLSVSQREARLFSEEARRPTALLSNPLFEVHPGLPCAQRRDIIFVGPLEPNSPNEDTILWFLANAFQRIFAATGARLIVAGACRSAAAASYSGGEQILFTGEIAEITPLLRSARVFVAPTRFAAGLPQKLFDAAANGIPAVVSPLLAEQMLTVGSARGFVVGDDAATFAERTIELYNDAAAWTSVHEAALNFARAQSGTFNRQLDLVVDQLATLAAR
jgi:glycosyltransferase involved in cell wall biosynthesis